MDEPYSIIIRTHFEKPHIFVTTDQHTARDVCWTADESTVENHVRAVTNTAALARPSELFRASVEILELHGTEGVFQVTYSPIPAEPKRSSPVFPVSVNSIEELAIFPVGSLFRDAEGVAYRFRGIQAKSALNPEAYAIVSVLSLDGMSGTRYGDFPLPLFSLWVPDAEDTDA